MKNNGHTALTTRMSILSIQSKVACGYVGNSIAVPAIQATGLEICTLDTVSFSNHPGHGGFRGRVRTPEELHEELEGLTTLGLMERLPALLSGYLGAPGTAALVAGAVDRAREGMNDGHGTLYVLDPVIGDHGRHFVADGVAGAIRDILLPRADIVTPNLYELGVLAGRTVSTASADITAAARSLIGRSLIEPGLIDRGLAENARPRTIAVTGIERGAEIVNLLVTAGECFESTSPRHARTFNGTGDLFAALLTAWMVKSGNIRGAFARAVGGLDLATRVTARKGHRELALPDILKGLKSCTPAALSPP